MNFIREQLNIDLLDKLIFDYFAKNPSADYPSTFDT